MSKRAKRSIIGLVSLLSVAACDGGDDAPASCELQRLERQGQARFALGETYWLPTPLGDCADFTWQVDARPDGSVAEVAVGNDGFMRLTPDRVGDWRLRLAGTIDALTITVAERPPEAFENVNYYPSSSLAIVAGELWTANAWDPSVTRVVDGVPRGRIATGPWPVAIGWREGLEVALVAQRGNDTVGFIDVSLGRLVDALWVGDEPADLVLSADGSTAWVALATEDAIAVVDVVRREVVRRVEAVKDPLALALSPDGRTLWVASLRSGQPDRASFGADSIDAERDLAAIDTTTYAVRYLLDVGHTITALLPSDDGARLYVAHTRGDPFADLVAPAEGRAAFRHEVLVLDAASGSLLASADLGRQATAAGPVVGLRDLAWFDDRLWVTSEGTDELVALDPETLAEVARIAAPGRPRDLLVAGDHLYAHGAQDRSVTRVGGDGAVATWRTGTETRPALIAAGQRFFTGAGRTYGVHWSCNTCHLDGGSDTLVWKAGPFDSRHTPRPLFWLEATMPLGWDGYSASARNFAHTGPVNIGVKATTAEADALAAYLESLVPPPAPNGRTLRDGSMSPEATLGEAIFEAAACTVCHDGALATNRALLDDGVTEGLTDVPSLVGSYRHVAWLKHGDASTLAGAVEAAAEAFSDTPPTDDELALLTRYVAEIVPRDLALIATEPGRGGRDAAVDRPLRLVFSTAVLATADNLARLRLVIEDATTEVPIAADIAAAGRVVTITPRAPLAHDTRHAIVVDAGFEALDERRAAATRVSFDTAPAPTLALEGDYRWVVDVPFPDFANGRFDNTRTVAVTTPIVATRGAVNPSLRFDFGDGLVYDARAVIAGDQLVTPGVPVPAGTALGDSRGLEGRLVDEDGDGIADGASGTLTLTGPGFVVEGVTWRLARPSVTSGCPEGAAGDVAVSVAFDDEGRPVIGWDAELGNALGLYVTDPGATLPLLPGQTVTDGAAYWALTTTEFPAGFAGPVTYGSVPDAASDASVANGAIEGGAPLEPGRCYQFSVTTNQFKTGMWTLRLPGALER